ncbi:MAG: response regulator, partial [Candidatus Aminicenantes bacterium]|nr:response regulator [Candidatus Aminicenantes bacterium]
MASSSSIKEGSTSRASPARAPCLRYASRWKRLFMRKIREEALMHEKNKKRILVVDDEITVCKSIRQAILTEDCTVDTALSGEEALKKEETGPYELIITDLMMPGISGLDLLKQLKKTHPGVTVIMVTGYPTIRTAVESVKLGAFDYLPKPFTPS